MMTRGQGWTFAFVTSLYMWAGIIWLIAKAIG